MNIMTTLVAQFGSNCQASLYEVHEGVAQLRASVGTVMDVPQGSRLSAALLDKFRQASLNRAPRMQFTGATPDGRRLSSSLTAISDTSTGEEIGLLKIDFCIEHLISSIDVLQTYCGIDEQVRTEEPSADDDIGRRVDGIIAEAFNNGSRERLSGKEYRLDIVRRLEEKDVFRVKGAVEIVSGRLNVSKYSIYNYLDQVRRARPSK
ncbi:MAG TPA: helix-turn-helix domain-containing protein [Mesorhizobium sp.]|uniref:helix-turn-helix domain-containing protein n=1 Tax=Mesorhizobium sp. TaxID=1871066 RepID=UPI002DDD13AC|nr:helix-turn-helix domain-containing protein [Mesorhizobium sp.]HEV2506974.1 helix-turn-helix domain-containing protein [Mesorhizobium sp.]